jgi:hypothetical protein
MPIPKPRAGEDQKKFISRCMGNPTMRSEYPEQKQRAGVCYSTWRKKKEEVEEEVMVEKVQVRVGNKTETAMQMKSLKGLRTLIKKEAPGDNQPVTPTPTKGETKDKFVARCMKRLKSRQSKEVVPARMKARCVASWSKAHGGKNMSDEVKMNANKILKEAFQSLQQALRKAIEAQPGKAYLADFSTTEVVYVKYSEEESEEQYFKVSYSMKDGKIELDGTPERVERKVTFEGEVSTADLIEFAVMDKQLTE